MRIENVDFFYLSMPTIIDEGDGSQDALLVRVRGDNGLEGWGECEAAPLPCIAAWCCPPSHSACKPVRNAVLGARIDSPQDIRQLNAQVRRQTLDLLQAAHTLSGIDVALWDLLGKSRGEPIYHLLGDRRAYPKLPYASVLFGDNPQITFQRARDIAAQGFHAAKFGWGPFGSASVQADLDQARAAREGLGPDAILMIDAGTIWIDDVDAAARRADALVDMGVRWLEEPFRSEECEAYNALGGRCPRLPLAAGEGATSLAMARDLLVRGRIRYLQIDAGRIGGITTAHQCRQLTQSHGATFVNHTFTSNLALCASIQPYVGVEQFELAEYPTQLKPLARDLTRQRITPGPDGMLRIPDLPGLGIEPDPRAIAQYLVPLTIKCRGQILYQTPQID